ncbi:large ribosomal subunit protein mL54 [Planococcus citri]|uniref:large ribosomal subunit protein mL54 n=1 Tax=Planococcus citri TaxID=170843 RepID=UPI0031F91787
MFSIIKTACNTLYSVSTRPQLTITPLSSVLSRSYAEPGGGGKRGKPSAGGKIKEFPIETDPHKLVNYCCGSNIYKEGEDIQLKPESEYPDWLWNIRTGPAPKLEDLDPNSKEYWLKVRVLARRRMNRMNRLKYRILKQF